MMNKRLKISLLLIITLIIGMVIGFLISGRITSHRIKTMRNNYQETGFGREIMRIIQPTAEQREKIGPIFKQYAEKSHDLMGTYHENQKELYTELKESLSEILTEDQIQRLEDHWKFRKNRYQKNDTTKRHRGKGKNARR